jgi:Short C-terminal domain
MPLVRRRPLLRAAAVGGGAYAMGKRNARIEEQRQDQAFEQGQQSAAPAPAYAPPAAPAAPAAPAMSADVTARLGELGQLHEQGVLTDVEFAQAKAKLLGL